MESFRRWSLRGGGWWWTPPAAAACTCPAPSTRCTTATGQTRFGAILIHHCFAVWDLSLIPYKHAEGTTTCEQAAHGGGVQGGWRAARLL
jgi:hypothetical protein